MWLPLFWNIPEIMVEDIKVQILEQFFLSGAHLAQFLGAYDRE